MLRVLKVKAQLEKIKAVKPTLKGLVSTSTSNVLTLLKFTHATWITHFLPTLYDCLGCLCEPFVISPDIIIPVQAVVNTAYLSLKYKVVTNNRLITMIYKYLLIRTSADGHIYRRKLTLVKKGHSLVKKASKLWPISLKVIAMPIISTLSQNIQNGLSKVMV